MKEIIKRCDYNRVGIIVPTKSLLVQTYNEIKSMGLDYKLIMHDEMYNTDNSRFIGILTQERALRIINRNDVGFELLFIDEAHSLMSDNFRSVILSRLIRLNKIRSENQRIIYLSPLVNDCSNLNLKHINSNIITQSIKRDLKTYEIFLWENCNVFIYDRFTNQYITIDEQVDFWQYITSKSKSKNFIYCYRPIQVEKIATELANNIGEVEIDADVKVAIKTLSREVHPSFYMISLLKTGVVYLHAKMPNIIKEYMEAMFKSEPSLKYIVANRVILEGINMPIDNMYITNTRSLDGKDLTNLIGRVNRLNYVFSSRNNLSSLISTIHFVANDDLISNGGNMRNKIKLLRDSGFADNVQNPLLENYDAEALNLNESKREKNQSIVEITDLMLQTGNQDDDKSRIRKSLIDNGIDEVYNDIDLAAETIKRNIDDYIHNDELCIIDIVKKIFISNSIDNIFDYEVQRLNNVKAVTFYNNYLTILQKLSLNERIGNFVSYFNEKAESDDPQLYIGGSYGEEPRITEMYNNGYSRNVYVNLSHKSIEERVNLAIVKIKIEDDFVSYKLMKFIVFLKDFNIITEEDYNNCVYGTNNHSIIDLVRYGLSVSVVTKLTADNQIENLFLDDYGNMRAKSNFNNYLSRQPELFKFEVMKYL